MTYRNKSIKQRQYIDYQNELRDEILDMEWPFGDDQVAFFIVAGFSNRGADLDNVLKPLFDTYQGIFKEFNDNKVYHAELHKTIVPKGREFLYVRIRRVCDEQIKEGTSYAEEAAKLFET
jgi:hypothetical protein